MAIFVNGALEPARYHIYLKDKLIDIPEITDPGAGEVEEGYQDELAEEKEVDSSVLGAEELR